MAAATALLSMATKNVGALAILMPVAQQLSRRTGTSISRLLMPMSFASLLGGLVTLVGTSTNIIVSQVREETLGKPFHMYDFAPVGLGLTGLGLVFLAFAYRLLPRQRVAEASIAEALAQKVPYVTEAAAPEDLERRPEARRRARRWRRGAGGRPGAGRRAPQQPQRQHANQSRRRGPARGRAERAAQADRRSEVEAAPRRSAAATAQGRDALGRGRGRGRSACSPAARSPASTCKRATTSS